MRKLAWICLVAFPVLAFGNAHLTALGRLVREHVRQATDVGFAPFTVTVPAHWSFQAVVEPKPLGTDGMTIDFIAAPGNLKTSKIYVGIRERESKMTMDQRRKNLLAKKGHRSKTVHWNGLTWILDEFQGVHPHTTAWSAYVVRSGKEYIAVGECPNRKRPQFEPIIMSVMKSVKFSERPAETRGQ